MLRRFFYVKIYPFLFLSWKPLLLSTVLFFLIFVLGVYFGLFRAPLKPISSFEAVPLTSAGIVKCKIDIYSELDSLIYKKGLEGINPFKTLMEDYRIIELIFTNSDKLKIALRNNEILSALSIFGNSYSWLHVLELKKSISITEILEKQSIKIDHRSKFKGAEIYEFKDSLGQKWSFSTFKGLMIISPQTSFVESAILSINKTGSNLLFDSRFRELRNIHKKSTLWLNTETLPIFLSLLGNKASQLSENALNGISWVGGGLQFKKDHFVFGGKMTVDKKSAFLSKLSRTQSKSNVNISRLIPENVTYAHYFSLLGFDKIYQGFDKDKQNNDFETYILPWLHSESCYFITDPTFNESGSDAFFILQSKDSLLSQKKLSDYCKKFGITDSFSHKGLTFLKIAASKIIEPIFGIYPSNQSMFFAQYDDYVIFCSSENLAKVWFDNILDANVLDSSERYKLQASIFRQPSEMTILADPKRSLQLIKSISNNSSSKFIENSFEYLKDLGHILIQFNSISSGVFSVTVNVPFDPYNYKENQTNVVWKCQLKEEALIKPNIIKNSSENKNFILIQDKAKSLYFIDASGRVLWQKMLDSKIVSEFYEIDYFNDNQFNIAFNTENSIYVLNANGEILKKIPLASKSSASLLCFEYEKELAFIVGCRNSKVYAYNRYGKPLAGWNPNEKLGKVYFLLENNIDKGKNLFVAMNRRGKLSFVSDAGKVLKSHFLDAYFNTGFYFDNSNKSIVTGASNGKIFVLNYNGKKSIIPPAKRLSKYVNFIFADITGDVRPDYIRQSKELLSVYSYNDKDRLEEKIRFIYPHSQDDIFTVRLVDEKKQYIGSFDATRGEVSLLSPEGKIMSGFPLKSNQQFVVCDLFEDKTNAILYSYKNELILAKIQ